jgi:outer membrane protein assembly factor BamB
MNKILFISIILFASWLHGADWPNYGGLYYNHTSLEKSLRTSWGSSEPKILWQIDLGLGFSSAIEYKGRSLSQGYKDGKNSLLCVDSKSGKIIWTHQYPCKKAPDYFQGGSRATPTAYQDKIFLQSHEGDVYCLDFENGDVIWSFNTVKDLGGERPQWGYSGSPLVTDGKLILQTGGKNRALSAVDPDTGKLIWQGGNDGAGYASPFIRKLNPKEIVVFNEYGLVLHRLSDGYPLKRYQHKTRYGINAAQPMEYKDKFLISSAYGKGAALVNTRGNQMKAEWESDGLSCQMASLVSFGDHAFGIHGQAGGKASQATLFCVDVATGRKRWEEKGFGVGSLIMVDQFLVILSDQGELTIADANVDEFTELERFQVLSGKTNWTAPTYANGRMYCRSSEGKLVCLAMGKQN